MCSSDLDIEQIKKYVINPVEAREASLELPDTLKVSYDIPEEVEILDGFNLMTEDEMPEFLVKNGLAMVIADLRMFGIISRISAEIQRLPK